MTALFDLSDIHFAYPGHDTVLDGIDFRLEAGEKVALVGDNGSGKSTLMHIMVGLLKPQKGRVVAFGAERRAEADFQAVRRRAGFVFQDPDDQLFCPTVFEDVAFGPLNLGKGPDEVSEIVTATLARLKLEHLRERITHKLSGGEKRLVTLAAVLAMEPDVLLLDEPTNALDEGTRQRLVDILNTLPQTLLVISHDPHFRRKVTERQWVLKQGELTGHVPRCAHAKK